MHPERFGKYEVQGVLGKGAMGTVYLAFDPNIERKVAIKTIRRDLVEPELAAEFMARFKNEAKAGGRLHHPNIVGVYEYGEDSQVTYIAMEYVDGAGLRDHVRAQESFTFGQLVELMTLLLNALDYAHQRGVVHRDIKPSNLLVTRDGVLKVADFGIARIDRTNLTSLGVVIGTPSYMSPEQCRGEETDARSDLFSVGVVLYELMTGERPFPGSSEAVTYKICNEEPAPPSQRAAFKLPAAVDQFVARALAKDPEARFATAAAFRDALQEVAKLGVEVDGGQGTTVVNIGTVMLQRPAPLWDEATLDSVEHELARFLGPLAKLIVHQAAAVSRDRAELCSMLSEKIDDPDTRRKFIDAFQRSTSGSRHVASALHAAGAARTSDSLHPRTRGTESPPAAAPLEAAFIDQVTARLAVRIGPIARIVTRKAAERAKGRSEFARIVADSVEPQHRSAFLREIGFPEA